MDTTASRRPTPSLSRAATLILLAIGPEERHGYAIMQEIERMTEGSTRLGPGGLYTTIRKLLEDGLIEESTGRPDHELDDQRRRYYRVTGAGRAMAAAEVARMQTLVRAARPWAFEAEP